MQTTTAATTVILTLGSLYLDVLFWLYGQDVATCCNSCYKMEDMMLTQKIDRIAISNESKFKLSLKLYKTGLYTIIFNF